MAIDTKSPENLHLPFVVTPAFSKRLGEAARHMSFAEAVVDTLDDSGITVELEGDQLPAENGLIVASDHGQRIEPLLVQAAVAESGRDATHVVAMPISFTGRLMQDASQRGKDLIIPVVPTGYSDQYKPTVRDDPRGLYRKLRFPHVLDQPADTLRSINSAALDLAADKVSSGDAVTIFPTGGSADLDWRTGIGEIARRLSPHDRATAEVTLFRPDHFSMKKVAGALALREIGIRPKKQTLVLRSANAGTVADIHPSDDTSKTYAREFTEAVRDRYRKAFKK